MEKIVRKIAKIIYKLVAINLPNSQSKIFGKFSKKIRGYLFNIIMENKGKNINIQKKVELNGKVTLGDNSGISANSILNGQIIIGKNVMIGPQVLMYARNHKTTDVTIPMIEQRI